MQENQPVHLDSNAHPMNNSALLNNNALSQDSLAHEQMRSLYNSLPVSLLSSIAIALILSISHWKVIGQAEIILWNLLLGSTLLARLILWICWHNLHQLYSATFWLRLFRIGVWLTGAAWGSSALLLFAHEDTIYQALLSFSLAGVASGSMTSLTVDKYSSLGFVMLTISPLSVAIFLEDGPTAIAMSSMTLLFIFFVIASSTRARHNMEELLSKNDHLLQLSNTINHKQKLEQIINNAQSIFIGDGDIKSALSELLSETLAISNSELGFIGQVERDQQQQPFMRALVFSSIKKNDPLLENFRKTHLPENGEYRNLDTLFGKIMRSDKPIISPNIAQDMRASTLPKGHPTIGSFIGIPIFNGREQIAILGLANAPQSYTHQTAEALEPILKSIAQFVQTMHHEQQHAQDKAALEASTQHTQTILNDIADGIITINKEGIIQTFNHAAETIFGYRAKQIIGKNVSELMPEPHKSLHDDYLKTHLKTGKKNILGIGREVKGLRRNGKEFPMDLMVSRVFQQGDPLFIGIVRDITEKRRIDDLRNQFISAASKEILGPLNIISEVIKLLQQHEQTALPNSLKNAIHIAHTNSIHLQKLMADLLEMQTLSQSDSNYQLTSQAVIPLVEQAVQRNRAYNDIYQCKHHITCNTTDLAVLVDKTRFIQVLTQLLQYSLTYSVPDSLLDIQVFEDRSRVKISLKILNNKMNAGMRANLKAYFTAEASNVDERLHDEGYLGLILAKEMIGKMHGKITIESKGESDYFVVEFPQAINSY
ncbi:PAS domain S-box protein [Cellvibrio sp. pealriver]|uniref:PAS domain S-box protein n=1 Tax=Cellvibrio sp. pealriver TaxID=1622269 RepID=UPI00066FDDC3|nr:PAS domain S-box protein [Cellvibrio sp. pealriver]